MQYLWGPGWRSRKTLMRLNVLGSNLMHKLKISLRKACFPLCLFPSPTSLLLDRSNSLPQFRLICASVPKPKPQTVSSGPVMKTPTRANGGEPGICAPRRGKMKWKMRARALLDRFWGLFGGARLTAICVPTWRISR